MKNLYEKISRLYTECLDELDDSGIYEKHHFRIVEYIEIFKSRSFYGLCKTDGYSYYIFINEELLRHGTDKEIKATIMHELIHTTEAGMYHGHKFKEIASEIKTSLGIDVRSRIANDNVNNAMDPLDDYKYAIVCDECGYECRFLIKSKTFKNVQNYRCKCGSSSLRRVYL